MARMYTEGLMELIDRLENTAQGVQEDLSPMMLRAGADQSVQAWTTTAANRHVLTGQMRDSMGYKEPKSDKTGSLYVEVYPQGYDSKRKVKNVEKAMYTHYGVNNSSAAIKRRKGHVVVHERAGDHWVEDVNRLENETVVPAMEKALNEYLKKKGVT